MSTERRFRLSQDYRLASAAELPAALVDEADAPSGASELGVALVPVCAASGTIKLVGPTGAALCAHLASSESGVLSALGEQASVTARLARVLTLDGVLDVEEGGEWLTGPAAASVFGFTVPHCTGDQLGTLSLKALQYAQCLALEPRATARRLYAFNRRPLPLAADPVQATRSAGGGSHPDTVSEPRSIPSGPRWASVDGDHVLLRHWRFWRNAAAAGPTNGWMWKLYISPRWEWLSDRLADLFGVLAESDAFCVKMAKTLRGSLRADHTVAYFSRLSDVERATRRLEPLLAGTVSQGVPFTCALTANGMLSWGADPPARGSTGRGGLPPESWRRWVTTRLAAALATASRLPHRNLEPWEYALLRLDATGVDVRTWSPSPQLLNEHE